MWQGGRRPAEIDPAPRPIGTKEKGCDLIVSVANGIHPWIKFTGVSSCESQDHWILMLDFQLKVEHTEEGEEVRFKYFEKA